MDEEKIIHFPQRIVIEVGGVVDKSSASLCIYGEDLDPDEITNILETKPTKAFRKGFRQGPRSKPSSHGGWFLEVKGIAPEGPDEILRKLLMRLPVDATIWEKINKKYKTRISFGIYMSGWNKGFSLSRAQLSRVSEMGILLDFDIYSYSEDDE